MRQTNRELADYYSARAPEYEQIYAKPERQRDLRALSQRIPQLLAGRRVLEVACGTGYWTQYLAGSAQKLVAIDISPQVVDFARDKSFPASAVEFHIADAFDLPEELGIFDGAFIGFWWSHIPRQLISRFLASLHGRLEAGALVVLVDNLYVEGSSTPLNRTDSEGNTYQLRQLADGSEYEVLKNFPTDKELVASVSGVATNYCYTPFEYYWVFQYDAAA